MLNKGAYRVRTTNESGNIVALRKNDGKAQTYETNTDGGSAGSQSSNYLEIMQKLIPGEAISLFLLAQSIIPDGSTISGNLVAILVLAVAILVRVSETKEPGGSWDTVQWTVVGLSALICFFWMHAIGGIAFFPSQVMQDFQTVSQLVGFALAIVAPAILRILGTGERSSR